MAEDKIEILDVYEIGDVLAVKYKFTFDYGKTTSGQANFHLGESQETIERVLSQIFTRKKSEYSDVGEARRYTLKQSLIGRELVPV